MTEKFLAGKIALVTGSSRGIGRSIALTLAQRGANVVVHCLRKQEAATQVAAEIESLGQKAMVVKANLSDPAKIETMFDTIEAQFGWCDIFVGNAASGVPKNVLELTDKHWDWTMDTNARSILHCAKRLAPHMKDMGWGRIVNITSPGSHRTLPHYSAIGMSKALVESLTRYLAVELAAKGITVNAVSPGLVKTDALSVFPIDLQEVIDFTAKRTPVGRLVTPEDVGQVVAFLCSEAASMIIGQTITVDGGYGVVL